MGSDPYIWTDIYVLTYELFSLEDPKQCMLNLLIVKLQFTYEVR